MVSNCSLVDKLFIYQGLPKQYDGRCEGYCGKDMSEPIDECRLCKINIHHKD